MTIRQVLRIFVYFAICMLGTLIVAIASWGQQEPTAHQAAGASPQLFNNEPKKLEFTSMGMGELATEKGVRLPFTNFKASDGVRLTAISREFDSPERAKEELENGIAKAVKLVERGTKQNKAGRVVGDRAHVVLSSEASGHPISALLWTQGRYFREITSTSWTDIVELEKRYSD